MTANSIILAVRERLGDTKKQRWADSQLLLYVSLCQIDICIFTNFSRATADIQLVSDTLIYDLPQDCIAVTRLEYQNEFFPIESRNSIDKREAEFPCALKDNLPHNKIEIVLSDKGDTLARALVARYGVLTDSDTDAIDTSNCELEDTYGVLTNVEDVPAPPALELDKLKVFYYSVPSMLINTEENLILPDMWLAAFIHFVSAMALQDDNDANNIQRGEMEMAKYNRLMASIYKQSSKDFTSNYKSKLTTSVRRV